MNYFPSAPETLIINVPVLKLILYKLPRHWKMSILHTFKVTDSRWKKSSWATSSICLCHSISSTIAFSQMMQKLLSQLQHPLFFFFPSPSSSGPAPDQSQPFLSAESLRRCQFKGQKRNVAGCCLLESQTNIAILRPSPAVQRPHRAWPAGAEGLSWVASALPGQGTRFRALEVCGGTENPPAEHTAPQLPAQASCSHRLGGGSSAATVRQGVGASRKGRWRIFNLLPPDWSQQTVEKV